MRFNINYSPIEDELLLPLLDEAEIGITLGRASVLLLSVVSNLESMVKLIPTDEEGNPKSIIFSAAGPPEYILELNAAIMEISDKWADFEEQEDYNESSE